MTKGTLEDQIKNLREALSFSPDNIPLRLHLAETLISANLLDEAEKEFQEVIKLGDGKEGKFGLAQVFFKQEEFSKCNVILEELLQHDSSEVDVLVLHAKTLVRENAIQAAVEIYQRILEINPTFSDEELDTHLRHGQSSNEVNTNGLISPFVQMPDINFEQVGGMEKVKSEIDIKIIKPLAHPELYKAYGKKVGGGILLYGPPGCGKTFVAKATAGQVNARFISVGLQDILDMWIGNSEKNLHGIFEIARDHKPCVLFFDEIDALGASRSDMKQSSGRHLINQFLQELDGLDNSNDGILVLGATNTPWHLDSAFRRPGRFDRIIFVPPPDQESREAILKLKLRGKPTESIDYSSLAKKTKDFSGADIEAIIDIAIEAKLSESFEQGVPKPLNNKDLQNAARKHSASTKEWFSTAKNFALFANDSGLYDDILLYMNLKKK